jgi:hypothetical protein
MLKYRIGQVLVWTFSTEFPHLYILVEERARIEFPGQSRNLEAIFEKELWLMPMKDDVVEKVVSVEK